jgi:hydroxymethylglutaryl-CoA lyase
MLGRLSYGHVSKAGPRPMSKDSFYPMNLPFIETLEQAKHFKLGSTVYEGCIQPWKEPIRSPKRPE